jgi:predicted Zn-dependent peptidase
MEKLRNQMENQIVSQNQRMLGIAQNLARAYMFFKNTDYVNQQLEDYKKITREQIREVAQKYLAPSQRLVLYYLPQVQKSVQ